MYGAFQADRQQRDPLPEKPGLSGPLPRREKQVGLTEKGLAYSQELLAPLHALEERVFELMGEDRVRQMVDAVTLFNTIFEKEMKRRNG